MYNITLLLIKGTIPWLLFFFSIIIIVNTKSISEGKKLRYIFLIVFLLSALRYGVGWDYYYYKDTLEGNLPDYAIERYELIPRYLALFCRNFHYQLFFVITSFISIYPVYWVTNRISPNKVMSFLIYILFPYFLLYGMGAIRNSMAYSLVLVMYYFLSQNKKVSSFCFFIVATCCHSSAFASIIIYPVYYLLRNVKINTCIYISSLLCSTFVVPLVSSLFSNLMVYEGFMRRVEESAGGGDMMTIIINVIGILNLLLYKKLSKLDINNRYYCSLVNMGVCIWNLLLPIDQVLASRLSIFFLYYIIFSIPYYSGCFKHGIRPAFIYFILFILFLTPIVLQFRAFLVEGTHMAFIPYQFFFDHTDVFTTID